MKKHPLTRDQSSPKRVGARRRAAQAEVTNYIHELSDRHAADAPAIPVPDTAATSDAQLDDA